MEFQLIIKKLKNKLSSEEKAVFDKWYNASAEHRAYYKKISIDHTKKKGAVKTDDAWKSISSKLNGKKGRPMWKIAVAAAAIGTIALSGLFELANNQPTSSTSNPITSAPIEIGDDKAILTLGNGTDIVLTNKSFQNAHTKSNGSQLIYDSIHPGPKEKAIVYNYLTVPCGGEFFVKLSDGTKIWLNSESKLKYPVQFTGNSRKVELLYGEAYFDVSPSTEHNGADFIVTTKNQTVKVLGTEFNIRAYQQDQFIATTLVEGKVGVTNSLTRQQVHLIPNQQAVLNIETNKLSVHHVDPKNIIGWKNGFFNFQNKSLKDIMVVLSRWYDIRVIFENQELKDKRFNGSFKKTQKIENILESIQKTRKASFKIEGKQIIIKNYSPEVQPQ